MKVRVTAKFISLLLNPPLIVTVLAGLVARSQAQHFSDFLAWWSVSALFLAILPVTFVVIGLKRGWVSDLGLSRREQRAWPLIFSIVFAIGGGLVLYWIQAPQVFLAIAGVNAVILSMALIISCFWKISFHTLGISSAVTIATMSFGGIAGMSTIFVLLTGWSRIYLDHHSISQVIAGGFLGSAVPLVLFHFAGGAFPSRLMVP